MRRLVYLVSTAGIPNLGDELIAATWLKYLARTAPDADVVLDCISPERVAAQLLPLHPRLRTTSVLWQLCFRNWSQGVHAQEAVAGLVARPDRAGDLREGVELLRRADVVHLTGGGFLNGIWPPMVGLLSGIATATAHSGAVSAVTGVGLAPAIDGAEHLVAELTSGFTVVDVRDRPSAELLGPGARHSCDDAFLSPGAWLAPAGDAPEVMVSLQTTRPPAQMLAPAATDGTGPSEREERARAGRSESGLTTLLAFLSTTLAEWGVEEVGLVECWPEVDQAVWARADRLAPKVRRYALGDVMRDGFPARAGQTWLSSRFHPHLFAAAAGASGVALSMMKGYYDTKHGSLIDQGSNWSLTHYRPFDGRLEIPARPTAGGFGPADLAALQAAKLHVAERVYHGGGA
ncbi:polysaccharide pyruvyl transferase family protein [Kitasatospora sp. NPDC048239]|uniref:polysaccharide pyruvyl transferase family protein n=1 Tax=Kitasatospora sp. NPDC048239 TaxID=3364046 RepID=UPI0037233C0D